LLLIFEKFSAKDDAAPEIFIELSLSRIIKIIINAIGLPSKYKSTLLLANFLAILYLSSMIFIYKTVEVLLKTIIIFSHSKKKNLVSF
jgi:hypothetical protein